MLRITLINPPYQTITSGLGVGHQVPLGLLMVGGPLLDAGHSVCLVDAERRRLSVRQIVADLVNSAPDVVMTGHAGSTPAHPVVVRMLQAIKRALPRVKTVYGGVYPSYHATEILEREACIDIVVRGEGEAVSLDLVNALQAELPLEEVPGISFRGVGGVIETGSRPPIQDLDQHRVGWELIDDWSRYRCFGLGRAAIVQFSRGCPHRCTYCGQHGFWVKWRHRSIEPFVDEIERLHREQGVQFFTLADENPTTLQDAWHRLLEEIAARELPVFFFATIRATDIVRDAGFLDLYRRAGILYILMGIESLDGDVLERVNKGSTPGEDVRACRLLEYHGIYSIIGHIFGLGRETWAGFRNARRALRSYHGAYLNAMYATPHSWTAFSEESHRPLIEPNQELWDYRHQVLAEPSMRPWELFVAVKWLEFCFHLHPSRLWRMIAIRDRFRSRQALWCLLHTGLVWLAEIAQFVFVRAGNLCAHLSPKPSLRPRAARSAPVSRRVKARGPTIS